jgi:hypothetical protein
MIENKHDLIHKHFIDWFDKYVNGKDMLNNLKKLKVKGIDYKSGKITNLYKALECIDKIRNKNV